MARTKHTETAKQRAARLRRLGTTEEKVAASRKAKGLKPAILPVAAAKRRGSRAGAGGAKPAPDKEMTAASKKRKQKDEDDEEEYEEEVEGEEEEEEDEGDEDEEGDEGGEEGEGGGSGGGNHADEESALSHHSESEGEEGKAEAKKVGKRAHSPRKLMTFAKRRRVSLKGVGAAPWKDSNKKLGNVTLVITICFIRRLLFCICYNGHYCFVFQETLKISVEKLLKDILRSSIPMFSDKTLLSYLGMSILPKLKIECTKNEIKNAWENRGLGHQLMKIVRSTVNSRAQAIRTQTTANFGQIFRVKPKQGEELIAFYQGVQDKLSQLCNPHDKVAWNKWECMMRRAYCVPLGHISKSVNYLHCITVEQEAFALASLTWYFTGKRGLTIVSLVLMVFIVIPV